MATTITSIDVCLPNGSVLFILNLHEKEVPSNDTTPSQPPPTRTPQPQNGSSSPSKSNGSQPKDQGNGKKSNGQYSDPMTDSQKRYLFRILAEQGIEASSINEELKKRLKVNNLKEVSKGEASRLIEQLLEKGNGGR